MIATYRRSVAIRGQYHSHGEAMIAERGPIDPAGFIQIHSPAALEAMKRDSASYLESRERQFGKTTAQKLGRLVGQFFDSKDKAAE
jgi:hypothetical protein